MDDKKGAFGLGYSAGCYVNTDNFGNSLDLTDITTKTHGWSDRVVNPCGEMPLQGKQDFIDNSESNWKDLLDGAPHKLGLQIKPSNDVDWSSILNSYKDLEEQLTPIPKDRVDALNWTLHMSTKLIIINNRVDIMSYVLTEKAEKAVITVLCPGLTAEELVITVDSKEHTITVKSKEESKDKSKEVETSVDVTIKLPKKYGGKTTKKVENGILTLETTLAEHVKTI